MRKSVFFILLFLGFQFVIIGQITLDITVYDKRSKTPVPFAQMQLENTYYGSQADVNGWLELVINNQDSSKKMLISALGYEQEVISVSRLRMDTMVYLHPKVNQLESISITAMSAQAMFHKMLDNFQMNLGTEAHYQNYFYRQLHKENNKYVRLIDAVGQVSFDVFQQTNSKILRQKMAVEKLRRSNIYERNGDEHGDHIIDLLQYYFLNDQSGTPFSKQNCKFYHFAYDDANDSISIIRFEPLIQEENRQTGKVYIDNKNFALLKYELFESPIHNRFNQKWMMINNHLLVSFAPNNGKFYVIEMMQTYNHKVLNPTGQVSFIVEEQFSFHFDFPSAQNKNLSFSTLGSLYHKPYNYSENDWYIIDSLYPIPQQVRMDLSSSEELNFQFTKQGSLY